MSRFSSDPQGSVQAFPSRGGSDGLRGALAGLIPLGLLAVLVVVALVLGALARQLTAAAGYFVQQQAALIVLIAGLVLAVLVYAVAVVLVMRRIALWQQIGMLGRVRSALWALGITALVVLLPLIVAIVLPQNPAP